MNIRLMEATGWIGSHFQRGWRGTELTVDNDRGSRSERKSNACFEEQRNVIRLLDVSHVNCGDGRIQVCMPHKQEKQSRARIWLNTVRSVLR